VAVVSRDRGHVLQRATAAYLARWWPNCESTPNGRPGRDILGTPGVWWEVKTGARLRPGEWLRQACQAVQSANKGPGMYRYSGRLPLPEVTVVLYWPPGVGERHPEQAIAMLPLPELMRVLVDGDHAPAPEESS
jgi:hypothetical protein